VDLDALDAASALVTGEHRFVAFAVRGTAPPEDEHLCRVADAHWERRPGSLVFAVTANRFLHQMVRFLVGTMLEIASGRRPIGDMLDLLKSSDNAAVSPPAPPHGLYLECVEYPSHLYTTEA
jgi:tRNA pseudouridine38-40 synthase